MGTRTRPVVSAAPRSAIVAAVALLVSIAKSKDAWTPEAEELVEAAGKEYEQLLAAAPPTAPTRAPALFIDAREVHVMRNDKLVKITGSRLVDESDLTTEEADELTAQRIVRLATQEELEAADQRAAGTVAVDDAGEGAE